MPVREPHPVFFREAVASILNQTLKDFELIILEAPPGLEATRTLGSFTDCRIRYFCDPSWAHVVDQRNFGLRIANSAEVL